MARTNERKKLNFFLYSLETLVDAEPRELCVTVH